MLDVLYCGTSLKSGAFLMSKLIFRLHYLHYSALPNGFSELFIWRVGKCGTAGIAHADNIKGLCESFGCRINNNSNAFYL